MRILKILACGALLGTTALVTSLPAFAATPAPKTAPKPATPTITVPPIVYKQRTLANGMQVYTSRDTTTPNVTIQMWYGVGAKDDPQGRSGFAHLFEHLMFKSTRNLPAESFDRLTEDVGGSNNASTWDDLTEYHETVPASHLQRLLWAEAERLGGLVVDDADFQSERHVVEEELRQSVLAQPYGRLFDIYIPQYSFATHPYHRSPIGSIANLDAATLDDVRNFHETYYRPDNVALIVVGNFDDKQLDAWVDQYMGTIKASTQPIPRVATVEPPRTAAKTVTTYGPNVPLPAVVITWLGPKASDPDAPAAQVLDAILSAGKSSRLYHDLVYDKQVASDVFSSADLRAQPGLLYVGAIMADGKTVEDGAALLMNEVTRLRDTPVTRAEIETAKTQLVAQAVRQRETIGNRAFALGYALRIQGDAARANSDIARLQAVTVADVQAAARKYLNPDLSTTIKYLPESARPAGSSDTTAPDPVIASVPYTGTVNTLRPEGQREAMPPVGATVSPVVPVATQMTLPNGLKVIVAKSSGLPLIAARLIVRSGASSDAVDKAGTASLMADVITEGTTTRSASDIAAQSEALGTSLSAYANAESAGLSLNVVKSKAASALSIMADVAEHPAFKAAEVDRVRSQTLDDLKVAYQQPRQLASFVTAPVIYAGTPLGHVIKGTPASLARITRDDLVALHKGIWRPDNATLVLTGDITAKEGITLARQVFGGWKAPSGKPLSAPVITPAAAPRDVIVDLPGTGQTAVLASKIAIARNAPDYYTGLVTNAVLGGGYSARLNQEIRIKRGLSYGASSALSPMLTTGGFTAQAQTKNESAAQVVDLMRGELTRLGTESVPADELIARKSSLIGGYGDSLATANGLAGILGNLSFYGIDLRETQAYTLKVNAVTTDQIKAFAKAQFDPSKVSFIIVGDRAKMGDAISKTLPAATIIPVSGLDLDSADLKAATKP